MNKEIEEIVQVIQQEKFLGGLVGFEERIAERLLAAGYRKQRVGEWVAVPNITTSASGREIHSNLYVCSLCGRSNGRRKQKFCPECGAKMKGESDER